MIRHGTQQKKLGEDFEVLVNTAIVARPELLGMPKAECLFSCKTEGSRGDVDIVAMYKTPDGRIHFPLIQAKRNGYLPPEDRDRLKKLIGHAKNTNVSIWLAHHITITRWRVTKLTSEKDFLQKRVREWGELTDDGYEGTGNDRLRVNNEFEMLVIATLKKNKAPSTVRLDPVFLKATPAFVIRLEESPGEPHIYGFFKAHDGSHFLALIYVLRESYLSPEGRERAEKFLEISQKNPEIRLMVAHYIHGKNWTLRTLRGAEDLEWFYYA